MLANAWYEDPGSLKPVFARVAVRDHGLCKLEAAQEKTEVPFWSGLCMKERKKKGSNVDRQQSKATETFPCYYFRKIRSVSRVNPSAKSQYAHDIISSKLPSWPSTQSPHQSSDYCSQITTLHPTPGSSHRRSHHDWASVNQQAYQKLPAPGLARVARPSWSRDCNERTKRG